jgi:cytochrome P450
MTASAQPQELLVRLLDPSNRADPYPTYAEIRERGALRLPEINLTVFSSYRDCDEVLRHPSAASDFRKATDVQARLAAAEDAHAYGEPSFLFLDPPDHTRLRKLVSRHSYQRSSRRSSRTSPRSSTRCSTPSPARAHSM